MTPAEPPAIERGPEAPAPVEEPEPPDAAEPERQTTPFLVLQFFVFPMAIVAVCVAVFVVFGLIASEGRSARDYLAEVRVGGANRRWQAAFEMSKLLQAGKDPALRDPKFTDEVVRLFQESERDDPRVRRYLALALGRLGDRRAVPLLLGAIRGEPAGQPADPETQVYAVWALGAIGDAAAVPELVRLCASEDAGLRKTAVHALGPFDVADARAALVLALGDAAEDVRWNAALALAPRGHAGAVPVLLQMMDRAHLGGVEGLTPEQREEAILQAVVAAGGVRDHALGAVLERLRDGDPNLKVREAAGRALADAR
jgi:HEAT repeat protein